MPPKKVPYFKPGKELKDLINKEAEAADTATATAPPVGGGVSQVLISADSVW